MLSSIRWTKSPFIYYHSYSLGHRYYNCWVHIEYLSMCIDSEEETFFFYLTIIIKSRCILCDTREYTLLHV